jgi:hypothetical protein
MVAAPAHAQAEDFQSICNRIDGARDPRALLREATLSVGKLLRRQEDDALRMNTVRMITEYFMRTQAAAASDERAVLEQLRTFSREAVKVVMSQRTVPVPHPETAPAPSPAPAPPQPDAAAQPEPPAQADEQDAKQRRSSDQILHLSAAEVEQHTAIVSVPQPFPERFRNFEELFHGALLYRVRQATTFFQRHNPGLARRLPRPFLLSPEFDAKFQQVLEQIIFPKMTGRMIAQIEDSNKWDGSSSQDFWDFLGRHQKVQDGVVAAWDSAWAQLRQKRTVKTDAAGRSREVLVASAELQKMREMLAPSSVTVYDLPPVRNREIDLFISLLTEFDRDQLELEWEKLRQLYEQEMDKRWYQQQAREGSLRDHLLDMLESMPDRTGDFLAVLCYFTMPRVNLKFLERFTHNKGTSLDARAARLPYLMRFLDQPEVLGLMDEEMREEEAERAREAERAKAAKG